MSAALAPGHARRSGACALHLTGDRRSVPCWRRPSGSEEGQVHPGPAEALPLDSTKASLWNPIICWCGGGRDRAVEAPVLAPPHTNNDGSKSPALAGSRAAPLAGFRQTLTSWLHPMACMLARLTVLKAGAPICSTVLGPSRPPRCRRCMPPGAVAHGAGLLALVAGTAARRAFRRGWWLVWPHCWPLLDHRGILSSGHFWWLCRCGTCARPSWRVHRHSVPWRDWRSRAGPCVHLAGSWCCRPCQTVHCHCFPGIPGQRVGAAGAAVT